MMNSNEFWHADPNGPEMERFKALLALVFATRQAQERLAANLYDTAEERQADEIRVGLAQLVQDAAQRAEDLATIPPDAYWPKGAALQRPVEGTAGTNPVGGL